MTEVPIADCRLPIAEALSEYATMLDSLDFNRTGYNVADVYGQRGCQHAIYGSSPLFTQKKERKKKNKRADEPDPPRYPGASQRTCSRLRSGWSVGWSQCRRAGCG